MQATIQFIRLSSQLSKNQFSGHKTPGEIKFKGLGIKNLCVIC